MILQKFLQYSEKVPTKVDIISQYYANFREIPLTSLIMRHLAGIIGRLRKGQSLVVAAEVDRNVAQHIS